MKKLFIIFAILCLAVPAMAADWNFYGSARMATFWTDNDLLKPADSDKDVLWDQQGNSRIGATVKFNDQIGGAFEMSDSFGKRKLYGTYTMGNGAELLFGQTYTPSSSYFYSNSVYFGDGDLLGTGQFYVGRVPMVQFKMGGLKLALIKPNNGGSPVGNDDAIYGLYTAGAAGAYTIETTGITKATKNAFVVVPETGTISDIDTEIPKIEAAYKFKTDMFFIDVFGGYQTYDIDGAAKDYSVDSYVVGLGGGLTMGPIYFNAGVHMGQNLGNYGAAGPVEPSNVNATQAKAWDFGDADYDSTKDDIVDNDGLGYLAVLGFNASEMLSIEAGYGFQSYELDVTNSKADEITQYYLNATINIAPGFFIVPEIGKVDFDAQEKDAGDFTYFGAKWQINF